MDELKIGDFNSYFELFVAFTFAYSGLSGFKDYINVASFHAYATILEKYSASLRETHLTVLIGGSERTKKWLNDKKDLAEIQLNLLRKIIVHSNAIFDGTAFRSQFYLTGAIFLSLIILSGFEKAIGDTVTFITVFFISLISICYNRYANWRLTLQAKGKIDEIYIEKLMSSKVLMIIYLIFFISSVGIGYLVHYKYSLILLNTICFETIDKVYLITVLKVSFILSFLLISLLPYLSYYKRRKFFVKYFDSRVGNINEKLNTIFDDIEALTESSLNQSINIKKNLEL
ncbi:hypothetical protein [Cytophaga aurantiaca]|uniref:hypothetical protein n=1 Tax=Cytophaga aurantiaca TaxID=29530 RepID=UPI00036D6384|nr:hypothetical protein [Cytophaga aurantiaca]